MRHAWEDEGDQVLQLNRLLPLTFPSHAATGPFLSPPGRGKTKHTSRPERHNSSSCYIEYHNTKSSKDWRSNQDFSHSY